MKTIRVQASCFSTEFAADKGYTNHSIYMKAFKEYGFFQVHYARTSTSMRFMGLHLNTTLRSTTLTKNTLVLHLRAGVRFSYNISHVV